MRRFAFVAAALALVPAFVPAKADASLRQRVNRLEAKMSCLARIGTSEYIGFAYYDQQGAVVTPVADPVQDSLAALNFDVFTGANQTPPDVWLLTVKNTRACRLRFAIGANPYVSRQRAANQRLMRLRRVQ